MNIVKEGDFVILTKGRNLKLVQVRKKRDIWLEKIHLTLDGAIGQPFGATFEIKKGELIRSSQHDTVDKEEQDCGTDNRKLLDQDCNQKLSQQVIEQMKKDGICGQNIVDQLIENSATFKEKTEYSQEKYIRKKKQKHLSVLTILKPTTRLLAEMYYGKAASKICYMRIDTLSQILTQGNVHAYCTVGVVDTCQGLVVGAVMERLGGFGKVIHFHPGSPTRPAVEAYDFPKEFMDTLFSFPLNQVNGLNVETNTSNEMTVSITENEEKTSTAVDQQRTPDDTSITAAVDQQRTADDASLTTEMDIEGEESKVTPVTTIDISEETSDLLKKEITENELVCVKSETMDTMNDQNRDIRERESCTRDERKRKFPYVKHTRTDDAREKKAKMFQSTRNLILERNLDCLIVACKFNPTPIVLSLINYVAPSRPVVVYSQYKEPLMDCYVFLKKSCGILNLRVSETWLREYQVLPNRTHPEINMSSSGGYLLVGITVTKS